VFPADSIISPSPAAGKRPSQPPRQFSPDGAVLFKLLKTCQQRDTADAWFQQFAAVVEDKDPVWDLSAAYESVVAKRRRFRRPPLDERTVLKARFASALYEMESSGLIACGKAGAAGAGGLSAVTIERKTYTWV
jgi:hypothetical protein